MNTPTRHICIVTLLTLLTLGSNLLSAAPLGTTFTYQGRLASGTNAANGSYDLTFTLYDALSSGSVVAGPLTNAATTVTNGYFTVALDFGSVFDGTARWLEIGVCTNGVASLTTLSPRQPLTPAPYALYAPSAGTAAIATVANSTAPNAVNSSSLQSNSITTDKIADGAMTDAKVSPSGISGDKIIGGDLQAQRLKIGVNHTLIGQMATIAGGYLNTISNALNADWSVSTIGGGNENRIDLTASATIAGGYQNAISNSWASTVAGGNGNVVTGSSINAIGGGEHNNISNAWGGTIPGGRSNVVSGNFALAAGYRAQAKHAGSFVWGDDTEADFASTADNQFNVRASGGVRFETGSGGLTVIGTDSPQAKLEVQGGPIKATGGLIIETRTSDPPSPATGQIWLITNP